MWVIAVHRPSAWGTHVVGWQRTVVTVIGAEDLGRPDLPRRASKPWRVLNILGGGPRRSVSTTQRAVFR